MPPDITTFPELSPAEIEIVEDTCAEMIELAIKVYPATFPEKEFNQQVIDNLAEDIRYICYYSARQAKQQGKPIKRGRVGIAF